MRKTIYEENELRKVKILEAPRLSSNNRHSRLLWPIRVRAKIRDPNHTFDQTLQCDHGENNNFKKKIIEKQSERTTGTVRFDLISYYNFAQSPVLVLKRKIAKFPLILCTEKKGSGQALDWSLPHDPGTSLPTRRTYQLSLSYIPRINWHTIWRSRMIWLRTATSNLAPFPVSPRETVFFPRRLPSPSLFIWVNVTLDLYHFTPSLPSLYYLSKRILGHSDTFLYFDCRL